MTPSQITTAAQTVVQIANSLKAAFERAREFSDYNSVNDPGWNSLSGAAVDANGLVAGTEVTPAAISNAIGSINEFINYWTGQPVPTSAWGQNIVKISSPIV